MTICERHRKKDKDTCTHINRQRQTKKKCFHQIELGSFSASEGLGERGFLSSDKRKNLVRIEHRSCRYSVFRRTQSYNILSKRRRWREERQFDWRFVLLVSFVLSSYTHSKTLHSESMKTERRKREEEENMRKTAKHIVQRVSTLGRPGWRFFFCFVLFNKQRRNLFLSR